MPLTVGELARRCGLTVRTLHHYDAIGLLKPSLRSDAGYRLYDWANIERLHRIQALRQLGLPLADIGTVLSGPEQPLAEVIHRGTGDNPGFITRLKAMQDNEPKLRERSGITPPLERFVERALIDARLVIFERYLLPLEMERMRANYGTHMHEWPPLIGQVRSAMKAGTPPSDPHARQLAQRWMELFRAYAGDDPATHARIREAYAKEPDLRSGSSVDPAMLAYVREAAV